ncbi:MAG: ferrochelatase [Chlamydiales bacterium]
MTTHKLKGLLLVNLGTPQSPAPKHVYRYLNEFLTDGRVIDLPWLKRQLLVRGIIVPLRYKQSAVLYQKIWMREGSPLLIHGQSVQKKLQALLGEQYKVVLSMRYQAPSIEKGLDELKKANVGEMIILPLFPQYASATTGSVHQKVMDSLKRWPVIPKLSFINSFPDHPGLIEAFCERGRQYDLTSYDHILFSFHGLPERHIRNADCSGKCLKGNCCQTLENRNQFCYKAQCFATARAIAQRLKIRQSDYTVCFQSRLGSEPWIEPYTVDVIQQCAEKDQKRVLVFCPAFVADCLETSCEISIEYAELFKELGGEDLQLVEGLNDHPAWINALRSIVCD